MELVPCLLRSDLHRLFDAGLTAVKQDGGLRLSPCLCSQIFSRAAIDPFGPSHSRFGRPESSLSTFEPSRAWRHRRLVEEGKSIAPGWSGLAVAAGRRLSGRQVSPLRGRTYSRSEVRPRIRRTFTCITTPFESSSLNGTPTSKRAGCCWPSRIAMLSA